MIAAQRGEQPRNRFLSRRAALQAGSAKNLGRALHLAVVRGAGRPGYCGTSWRSPQSEASESCVRPSHERDFRPQDRPTDLRAERFAEPLRRRPFFSANALTSQVVAPLRRVEVKRSWTCSVRRASTLVPATGMPAPKVELRDRVRRVAYATTWRRYCKSRLLYRKQVFEGVAPCLMWRDDAIEVAKKILLSGRYLCLLPSIAPSREEIDGPCCSSAPLFSDNGEIPQCLRSSIFRSGPTCSTLTQTICLSAA